VRESNRIVVALRRVPGARAHIVCFPWAGAGVAAFHPWVRLLPSTFDLSVIRLPGRESRIHEGPFTSLVDAANAVACSVGRCRKTPTIFFGHSLGALLAFETAVHLEAGAGVPPDLVIVSGAAAPGKVRSSWTAIRDATDKFRHALVALGIDDDERADVSNAFLASLKADLFMAQHYGDRARPALSIPIVAYAGRVDASLDVVAVNDWTAHSRVGLTTRWFDGGHFFLREHSDQVTQQLIADVVTAIRA
jgi:surfactin synthase thioesterase subunit